MFLSRTKVYSLVVAVATLIFSQAMKVSVSADPAPKVIKSEEEWKKVLTPEQYQILRKKGTEAPFKGKYDKHFEKGSYKCAACGYELFTSTTKFDSHCGWPAFYAAAAKDRVILLEDKTHGMTRVEVQCANCHGHLGHVFENGDHDAGMNTTPHKQAK